MRTRTFTAVSPDSVKWDRVVEAQNTSVDGTLSPELGSEKPSMSGLPQAASAKLARWRQDDEDARALASSLFDRQAEVRVEQQRLGAMLRNQQRDLELDDNHPAIKELQGQVDRATREIRELGERINAIHARRSPLFRRLEAWLSGVPNRTVRVEDSPQQHHQSGLVTVSTGHFEVSPIPAHDRPVKAELKRGETLAGAVDRVRKEMAELRADLHAVRSAPIPSAVAKRMVREQIEALARAPNVLPTIEAGLPLGWPQRTMRGDFLGAAAGVAATGRAAVSGPDGLAVLCWLHRDALIERLEAEVDDLSDDSPALCDEERAEREAALLLAILEAERVEESFIEQAEAVAGQTIARRPDADPRAVLGLADSVTSREG
jgi:hypothetical protein